jgi:transmembrane sensor
MDIMSDAYSEDRLMESDAKSVRARAAEWHDRRERDDWNEEKQVALNAWLAASPAHMVAFLRVDSAWRRADRLSALHLSSQDSEPTSRRWIRLGFIRFAAGIGAVAVLGIAAASYFSKPHEQYYETAIGGHKMLALDGGSQIELNTNTALRVSLSGGQREVWLDRGEAYFQVKHDAMRPFVVMVAGHRVTDLGTKFAIRRDTGSVRVAVMQGRVGFDRASSSAQRPATLTQGDVLVATGTAISVTRKQADRLIAELGWRRGMLVFDNTTLADAVAEFNRYNSSRLVVVDRQAARIPIDGKFRTNDAVAFTFLVQGVLGLRVAKRGDETVISR